MKQNHLLLALVSSLLGTFAVAAPFPGTATSTLVAPQIGMFRSKAGFQLNAGESGWQQSEPPVDNKFIATLYKARLPAGAKIEPGSLTVRVDQLAKNQKDITLDKYVARWLREYPRYGFDVLGSKPFTQNKERGYVLDLINRDNGRQLRQVVFLKKQRAVILTCRDLAASFKDSLKSCNQIIKTFQWVE